MTITEIGRKVIMEAQIIDHKTAPLGGVFDCCYDKYFTLLYADESLFQYLGYTKEEFKTLFQNHLIEVIYKAERLNIMKEIEAQVKADKVFMYENRLVCKDGSLKWVWISAQLVYSGHKPHFHCIFHDISEEKSSHEKLAINEKRFQIVLSQTQDIVFEQDCITNQIYYSENFEKKFGYQVPTDNFPVAMMKAKIIHPDDQSALAIAFQSLHHGADTMMCEYRLKYRNQGYRWVEASATAIRDKSGNILKIVGIIKDTHEKKEAILLSQKEATLDPLTGLYNRKEFMKRFNEFIQTTPLALILIDIDDFKEINDTLGHLEGDQALLEVADGLRNIFSNDLVARFGGDEFVICIPNLLDQENLRHKINQLQTLFQKKVLINSPFTVSCSIGVSMYPQHGDTFMTLFDKADIAMYQAKKNGKNQYCFFNEKLHPFHQLPQPVMKKSFHDHIIEEIIQIVLTHPKNEDAIPILLRKIEQFIDCDRITVYENGKKCYGYARNDSYQLVQDDIHDILKTINFFEDTLIDYNDVDAIENLKIKQWLKQRQAKAAILSSFLSEEQKHIFICYEDCQKKRAGLQEIRYSLSIISNIIHVLMTREQAQLTLEQTEAKHIQFLMEHAPGNMLVYYVQDGFPLYFISEHLLTLLGYENEKEYQEAIHGYTINSIYQQDRVNVKQQIQEQINATGEYDLQYRLIKKDASFFWVRNRGKLMETSDHKKAILSNYLDITAEVSYHHQLQIYQNASNGGAFINAMDEGFSLLYGNDKYFEIYEMDKHRPEEYDQCIKRIHPDDVTMVKDTLTEAFAQQEPLVSLEFKAVTAKGNTKWISLHGTFEYRDGQWTMNGFILDITKEYLLKKEVSHKEMVYRTALNQMHINVWEYNIKESSLKLSSYHKNTLQDFIVHDIPQSLIDQGWVHSSSVETIKELYQKLKEGIPNIQRDILIKGQDDNSWHWERIKYQMLYDQNGLPSIAVAVGEDVTREKHIQKQYLQELQYQLAQNKDQIASFQCNLTKNHVVSIKGNQVPIQKHITYDELLELHTQFIASKEDILRFDKVMNRKAILEAFYRKETFLTCDFRRKDVNGKLYWCRAISKLMIDAKGSDLYLIGILQDMEDNKRMEQLIENKVVKDPITHLYDKRTFEQMCQAALSHPSTKTPCALMLFQVASMKEMELLHHHQIDLLQKELAAHLLIAFSKDAFIGRLYADEYAVFLYGNFDFENLQQKAEEIRRFICSSLQLDTNYEFHIYCGISMEEQPHTYLDLYEKAKSALQQAKYSKTNQSIIYQDASIQPLHLKKEERGLDTVLLSIASSFGNQGILQALKEIQTYYEADRVYLSSLLDDQTFYEVVAQQKTAFKPHRELLHLDYLKKQTHSNAHTWTSSHDLFMIRPTNHNFKDPLTSFTAMSLLDHDVQIGLLCMENATQHIEQLSLFQILGNVLALELMKLSLQNTKATILQYDSLTGVLNRDSFRQYQKNIKEDILISLGVLSIDINGLKSFNNTYGMNQGDHLVCTLANKLKESFQEHHIYRISSDEFLIIMENISYEAFQKKVSGFKQSILSFPYAAVGSSWAEKQISLDNLIRNAEEQRFLDKQIYYNTSPQDDYKNRLNDTMKGLRVALENGKFVMYLQQKVDSNNDLVIGAEALIRYQDDTHGLVSPTKFIPLLERMGLVHYLDFFIFEQVCQLLVQWKKKGITLIPISLNFSRVTLLSNQLVQHMNEIIDPLGLEHDLIEIEITENMGEIERNTIITMCKSIKSAGYHLALDDFGTKYSNIAILSDIVFHTLKFDKGLIDYLVGNDNSRMILESIIGLCKKLDIYNVAEGVETKEQMEILKELGCTYIQGYYYSRPVPASAFDFSHNYHATRK